MATRTMMRLIGTSRPMANCEFSRCFRPDHRIMKRRNRIQPCRFARFSARMHGRPLPVAGPGQSIVERQRIRSSVSS